MLRNRIFKNLRSECLGANPGSSASWPCGLGQVASPMYLGFLICNVGLIKVLPSQAAARFMS